MVVCKEREGETCAHCAMSGYSLVAIAQVDGVISEIKA